ncbi:MAG: transporter substrate-binding domain-containing protein [Candidatus Delongbacteria bacterium]|nr:transporter substrate-binding domain-containing protein [Candidatus Delongbacteria bacterium]MBN2835869.1 transporter substrate-binding domain-containing protein [Candidatus Delongbacteria bacterium]
MDGEEKIKIVRGDASYYPYEIMNADDTVSGLYFDIVDSICCRLNLVVEVKSLPWKRAILMIKTGEADAITCFGRSIEREEFAIYHENNILSNSCFNFFTLKENSEKIIYSGNLNELAGYKISLVMGYFYNNVFDDVDF